MSNYRLTYQFCDGQVAGYHGRDYQTIVERKEDALVADLSLEQARLWLAITHENFMFEWHYTNSKVGARQPAFQSLPCWKECRFDEIRILLEEVCPDDTIIQVEVSDAAKASDTDPEKFVLVSRPTEVQLM